MVLGAYCILYHWAKRRKKERKKIKVVSLSFGVIPNRAEAIL
jgi:hypothetical protein